MKNILYYFPTNGIKNKAKTANVTIDWFKKKFILPLDLNHFTEIAYQEEGEIFEIPNLKDVIAFTHEEIIWQGEVEKIIRQKTVSEGEFIRILLKPIE
jgi:hypothetical protein